MIPHPIDSGDGLAEAASGVTASCLITVSVDACILTLPAGVTRIESEAFAGLGAGCAIELTGSVTFIAPDAFAGTDITIIAPEGSHAAGWALEHGIPLIPR